MKHVEIYTDGACRGNPGPGGWGALLRCNAQEKTLAGFEAHTTNNRMELLATIRALEHLREPCRVDIHTDSQYVQKGMTLWLQGWKKRNWRTASREPVKNADLWQALELAASRHQVQWHWVRGHNGHVENERADKLARDAIDGRVS